MPPPRKLPTRRSRTQKTSKRFDPNIFLTNPGVGRTVHRYKRKQFIFVQGDPADAVFYIQEGRIRVSVLSKQGRKRPSLCSAPASSWARDASLRTNRFACPVPRRLRTARY